VVTASVTPPERTGFFVEFIGNFSPTARTDIGRY